VKEISMNGPETSAKPSVWLTPRKAAEYLGVGVDSIYDGCAAGGLKHTRLGHRTIRLRREWLDAWAEAHTRTSR
jgi:excisionase family DNA binding protein